MANTRELRRRIRSVKNTSQITKAMEMVAATKMRKAQGQALSGRPYYQALNRSILHLLPRIHPEAHPLMRPNKSDIVGVLLLTTDKSLCGALNTNVFRTVQSFFSAASVFYTVGKKGRNFVVKTGKELIADFENHEILNYRQVRQISKLVVEAFLSHEIGELYIVYPQFVSTLKQEASRVKILPIHELVADFEEEPLKVFLNKELIFEPSADVLLEYVLVHSVEEKIYQAMLETKASEHSARMIAMQNATNNAKELVSDLQLAYNQTRQEAITRELLEITSAQAALE